MSKLADFLINLTQDADLQAKYKADPRKAMQDAGLSDAEINMVINKDVVSIQNAVGDDIRLEPNGNVRAYRK